MKGNLNRSGFLERAVRRDGPFVVAILAVVATGLVDAARGQGLTEFSIPTPDSRPLGITAGLDGAVWFTESHVNKIARITPAGVITEFLVPTANSQPWGVATGQDGNLWFVESLTNKIGRITAAGDVTEFTIPTAGGPEGIAAGPDGNLWFTNIFGRIGRITPAGVITEFAILSGALPLQNITAGPDGAVWFVESGANDTAFIGRITTAGVITEFAIPTAGSFPTGIVSGPDGALWFSEYVGFGGKIGRITTAGVITEFPIPAVPGLLFPTGGPGGIAAGPDGALWFTELGGIGRITTAGVVTQFLVPNASTGPAAIAAGPDGKLWFIEGVDRIGRIGPAACPLSPTILCLNNSRFKVEATWTSSDGRNGSGHARFLSQGAGYLWFSAPDNPELMVKTLDGCSLNNNYWIFAAGLTNLGVVLKITDVLTGQVKTYANPQGTAFQPIQDTNAFTCQ